jgi:hypothetical protein
MKRFCVVLVLLAGCSHAASWIRADGQPIAVNQLQLDETYCKSEVPPAHTGPSQGVLGASNIAAAELAWKEAYARCMAGRGYLAQN